MIGQVILLAAALSAGNAEFERTASETAARVAARRVAVELAKTGPQEGTMKREMLAKPQDFATREEAQKKCAEIYADAAKKQYEAACKEIRKRLALPETYELKWTDGDANNINAIFPKAFDAERNAAVTEQAKGIVATIRPTEQEFETVPEAQLRAKVVEQVISGQKVKVFDENKKYISDQIVTPMIAGAYAERQRQREYLMRARCDSSAPSKLREELTKKLNENVATTRAKEKDVSRQWGVFPSVVSNFMDNAVERRTMDKLHASIAAMPFKVSVQELEDIIAKNPADHKRTGDSERKFVELYESTVVKKAMDAMMQNVPGAERAELDQFFTKERLASDEVKKSVEKIVRKEVMPNWKIARDTYSGKQMEKLWPEFANDTWYPEMEVADEVSARSDYVVSVRMWDTRIEGMKKVLDVSKDKPVFDTTWGNLSGKIAREFNRARDAITKQNGIVDVESKELLAKYREESARPKLPEIVKDLTTNTSNKWVEARIPTLWGKAKLPKNVDEQHVDLYPSVKAKIDVLSKAILQELSQSSVQASGGSDVEEEKVEPYTISVTYIGTRLEVELKQGSIPIYSKNVDANMIQLKNAMQELSEKLGRNYLYLK